MPRIVFVVIGLGLLMPPRALAQGSPVDLAGSVFETQVRDRWLHGRQRSAFTGFGESRVWIGIDSVRSAAGDEHRTLHLTFRRSAIGGPATVRFDASGRVTALEAALREPPGGRFDSPEDSARYVRRRLLGGPGEAHPALPETRVWGLPVGIAITMEPVAKNESAIGPIPVANMWCAQTPQLRKPISTPE